MFTIYSKSVGGRKHDRYYKLGWKQINKIDKFNTDKGFYVFQYNLITNEGEEVVMSLIHAYFED